jgi:CheY-like chemotaxis protein
VSAKLRVVIADDERPARSFPAAMLRAFEDVEIVGEAENGVEAVEVIERERPDLALLDLQMPEVDGLLKDLEARLDPQCFVRLGCGTLANVSLSESHAVLSIPPNVGTPPGSGSFTYLKLKVNSASLLNRRQNPFRDIVFV